jgi:hypothetical protein
MSRQASAVRKPTSNLSIDVREGSIVKFITLFLALFGLAGCPSMAAPYPAPVAAHTRIPWVIYRRQESAASGIQTVRPVISRRRQAAENYSTTFRPVRP